MEYGILGAGHIGQALAAHLTRTGHSVILSNSRGPAATLVPGRPPRPRRRRSCS
jgi:predicted dinucleotide-binding enzyme